MFAGLFAAIALIVPGIFSQTAVPQCNEVDVVAVVDGSDSISLDNFNTLQGFLLTMASNLNIGEGSARMGVILYSSDITTTIPFSSNRIELFRQIAALKHARDGTNTALAVSEMNMMFSNYSRPGGIKVGVVITDGNSKDHNATAVQSAIAKNADINMFVVGITSRVNSTELNDIASSDANVLMAATFGNLNGLVKNLVEKSCSAQCTDYLEVVALVDGSDSISSEDFIKLKQAQFSLVKDISVSPGKTRFGLILYSSSITKIISLSDNETYLLEQISDLQQPRDGTETALGLARMNQLFRDEARPGVPKIGLVITDGLSKSRTDTITQAGFLKTDLGVNMFAVGITNMSDINELSGIATMDRNILTIDIFDDLEHILRNLVTMFCPLAECKASLDILAVVDGSDSISTTEFEELKTSLSNLVIDLDIGNSSSRFGLILYSGNITAVIPFSTNITWILSEIDSLDHPQDGTETALALQEMLNMFTSLGRAFIQRVGIVITDGWSKDPNRTKIIAQDAKAQGISMFAVGVNDKVNEQELVDIASPNQVFTSDSFLDLSRSLMDVVRKVCPDLTQETTTSAATTIIASTIKVVETVPTTTTISTTTTPSPTTTIPTTTLTTTPIKITEANDPADTTTVVITTTPTTTPAPATTIVTTASPPITQTTPTTMISSPLCDECKLKNGIYVNSHPTSCTMFILCREVQNGSFLANIKECPSGLVWDNDALTCNYQAVVNCTKDPCYNLQSATYSLGTNCREYYTCIDNISYLGCCSEGMAYDVSGGQCAVSSTCTDQCTIQPVAQICDSTYREIIGDRLNYEVNIGHNTWITMACAAGAAFNITTCACSDFAIANPQTSIIPPTGSLECRAVLYLPFTNDTSDQSGFNNYVQNNGVIVQGGVAYFNGLSGLIIPRFANVDFRTTLTIRLKYRVDGFTGSQQALVTNGDCGTEGSIYIVSDAGQTTFGMSSETTQFPVASTSTFSTTEWNEVEFKYVDGVLRGIVNGITNNRIIGGSITRSQYALHIGEGDRFDSFKGWIDEVYVYMC